MNKKIIGILIMISFVLFGCTNPNDTTKDVSINEIKSAIYSEDYLTIQSIEEFTPDKFYLTENYADKVDESLILTSGAINKLQDIIIIKTEHQDIFYGLFKDYQNDQKNNSPFANVESPNEGKQALEDSVVGVEGNYVYYIAAEKSKEIENKLKELLSE